MAARFSLCRLPVCTQSVALIETDSSPSAVRVETARRSPRPPLSGKRILVVDDEESIRELVSR